MLVAGFVTGALATNCWLVATAPGEPCVVVDPGIDAAGALRGMLGRHRLRPAAVVMTHGHLDHTWAAAQVCDEYRVPAYLHPADRRQLTDPWSGLGVPPGEPLFGRDSFAEPADLRALADGEELRSAGVSFSVTVVPGHTPGSVLLALAGGDTPIVFGGDVLFAGSIGRTDLPGGSEADMVTTLARVILALDDRTVVHPGHGDSTTIARERATNPFLRAVAEAASGATSGNRQ